MSELIGKVWVPITEEVMTRCGFTRRDIREWNKKRKIYDGYVFKRTSPRGMWKWVNLLEFDQVFFQKQKN